MTTCWITLITVPSYLPGAIILAYSLQKHGSKYPLVVQYTSSLGTDAIELLHSQSPYLNIIPQEISLLFPREENTGSVADRFKDTWTKLRAFEIYKSGYERCIFLDADMAIFRNPDDAFDTQIPGDWIGANHSCVCNLDHDPWAPEDWKAENCAYTSLGVDDIAPRIEEGDRRTYKLLNSGMFLFYPSEGLWISMMDFFNTSSALTSYQFPDQDFLADFFKGRWKPMSWKYNAIKTMRYWHPKMWSDDQVVVVHYIVDKPWSKKVIDGVAGYLGRDGVTHEWWWGIYGDYVRVYGDTISHYVSGSSDAA